MKRTIFLMLFGILFMPFGVSAETVTVDYYDRDSHYNHDHSKDRTTSVTVHDKTVDTDTNMNGKNQEDLELNVGFKAEFPIKNFKETSLEITGKKDMNQTTMKEGYEVDVIVSKKFGSIDLNPFNWFKK